VKTEPPVYRGQFVPKLFTELLSRIRSMTDSTSLRKAATDAMELSP